MGRTGAAVGAHFLVGARMAASHPFIHAVGLDESTILIQYWADPEKAYQLQMKTNGVGGDWTNVGEIQSTERPAVVELEVPRVDIEAQFHQLIYVE